MGNKYLKVFGWVMLLALLPWMGWGQEQEETPATVEIPVVEGVYELSTAEQMRAFAKMVNDGSGAAFNARLMNDIDLTEENGEASWTPIGASDHPYVGTFDGQSYTLTIKIEGNDNSVGLFGCVGKADVSTTIKNLTVTGSVSGSREVGGICGYAEGNLSISNCVNQATVRGSSGVGGILGYSYSDKSAVNIDHCQNEGAVVGNGDYVGGIIGYSYNASVSIKGCTNTKEVKSTGGQNIGGIAGYVQSVNSTVNIEQCRNEGSVVGNRDYVGGISGFSYSSITIMGCTNEAKVESTGGGNVGGISGYQYASVKIENCQNKGGFVKGSGDYVGGISGFSNSSITIKECTNGAKVESTGGGYVSGISGYQGNSSIIENCLNEGGSVQGVGNYVGGISGYSGNSITIMGCTNEAKVESTEGGYVGGISGHQYTGSKIENCRNEGEFVKGADDYVGGISGQTPNPITIISCINLANVKNTGGDYVGGILGLGDGSITNCQNKGVFVEGASNYVGGICGQGSINVAGCTNKAMVKSTGRGVGGILGEETNGGSIVNCMNLADVEGSEDVGGICGCKRGGSIMNCGNTGKVTATAEDGQAAGICGDNDTNISNCYNLGAISAATKAGIYVSIGGSAQNCYFLESDGLQGVLKYDGTPVENSGANPITQKQVDSGELVFLLNKSAAEPVFGWKTLEDGSKEIVPWSLLTEEEQTNGLVYEVKVHQIGETEEPAPSYYTSLEEIELPEEEGYTYAWYSSEENGEVVTALTESITDLYPRKTAISYTITVSSSEGGTVTASPTTATIGMEVTLTATPNPGYEFDAWNIEAGENLVTVDENRTFTMPASNVTVSATFSEIEQPEPEPEPEPEPDPDPVPPYEPSYYTLTIPESVRGAIIHDGGSHTVKEYSYYSFTIEIDPNGTGQYPTVYRKGQWWNALEPDENGTYQVYIYSSDTEIEIGEVPGYGRYALTFPTDSLFETDTTYCSGDGITFTASTEPDAEGLYPFGTEVELSTAEDVHRRFESWWDGTVQQPYRLTLREDLEATAWYTKVSPVGNEEIAPDDIRILAGKGTITVRTPRRLPIHIYNVAGVRLEHRDVDGETRFTGLQAGSYLVVAGGQSQLVVVR